MKENKTLKYLTEVLGMFSGPYSGLHLDYERKVKQIPPTVIPKGDPKNHIPKGATKKRLTKAQRKKINTRRIGN